MKSPNYVFGACRFILAFQRASCVQNATSKFKRDITAKTQVKEINNSEKEQPAEIYFEKEKEENAKKQVI